MIRELYVAFLLATGSPIQVIDGDTVRIQYTSIRLDEYDAPELYRPRCEREYILAAHAAAELMNVRDQLTFVFVPCATHNYGRLCARGILRGMFSLSSHMVQLGVATRYVCTKTFGCPQKKDWCK